MTTINPKNEVTRIFKQITYLLKTDQIKSHQPMIIMMTKGTSENGVNTYNVCFHFDKYLDYSNKMTTLDLETPFMTVDEFNDQNKSIARKKFQAMFRNDSDMVQFINNWMGFTWVGKLDNYWLYDSKESFENKKITSIAGSTHVSFTPKSI